MPRRPRPLDDDDVILTDEELATMRPAVEVMPAAFLAAAAKRRGRPKKAVTKELVSLRLERATLDAYRATGRGWQARMSDDLDRAAKRQARREKTA
ncbi:MAG: hypothetical protein ABS36_11020 [Acidobacteria bacterium SCN 69-37]|nr:MAG: hypothetical protein ABS36_11020 [Acidobacteria bacterium SCN 69-37]